MLCREALMMLEYASREFATSGNSTGLLPPLAYDYWLP